MNEGELLQVEAVVQRVINERLDGFEERVNQHFKDCRDTCIVRIINVNENTQKAHERLNEHSKSIKCLDMFKNKVYGALGVIGVILAVIGIKIW